MQASSIPKPYTSVSVLHLCYNNNSVARQNLAELERAWRSYGYEVYIANEWSLGVKPHTKWGETDLEQHRKSSKKALKRFGEWLEHVDAYGPEDNDPKNRSDGVEKLIIVCYSGHAAIWEKTEEHYDQLYAISL